MSRLPRILILFLLCGLSLGLGQRNPDGRRVSLDCVTCHVTWHDNIDPKQSLLPPVDAPIQIQGMPARVPTERMCFSCHDGTIQDSRENFVSRNHKLGMNAKHVNIKDLPKDKQGKIYCGTCHTPHSLAPNTPGGLAPFLRKEVKGSTLCLDCHSNQSVAHKNHPIKIKVPAGHSMPANTFWGKDGSMECMTCHPIHGPQAAVLVKGNDRTDLCASCHKAYFNIKQTDHDLSTAFKTRTGALGPDLGSQDACSACHVSHNGKAAHMWSMEVDPKGGENAYCIGCHSKDGPGREKIFTHAGHPVDNVILEKAIPALGIKAWDKLLCKSCHDPHQWEFAKKHAVGDRNEEGTEYTSFLRLPDDAQGQLCVTCHADQASMFNSDHSVAREGFQQFFRESNKLNGQCTVCHGAHTDALAGSKAEDPYTVLCLRCHDGKSYPTSVVHNNHPIGVPFKSKSNLPGYESKGQKLLSCNTCHDPHKWGETTERSRTADLSGDDRNSFLTLSNWPEPKLCLDCHSEQKDILKTDHDLTTEGHSACSQCHSPHNAETQYGIFAKWGDAPGASFNEKHCFSCHNEKGVAASKLVEGYSHPREFGILSPVARGTGKWLDFPLFTEAGPSKTVGHIDCFTCHDPHKWSYRDMKPGKGNAEGNDVTSFLRNPSQMTLCKDCHGAGTLWKYNYYHDSVKRKRY